MAADRAKQLKSLAILCSLGLLYAGAGRLFSLAERNRIHEYFDAYLFKSERASDIEGPQRILLSGGSNVLWGYRSAAMQAELGIPVANVALPSEGWDSHLMRDITVSLARPGDIVVYASLNFWNIRSTLPVVAERLRRATGLDPQPEGWWPRLKAEVGKNWRPIPEGETLAASLPFLYRRFVRGETFDLWSLYNRDGDVKICVGGSPEPRAFVLPPLLERDLFVQEMQKFQSELEKKGARLLVDIPWQRVREVEKQLWVSSFQPLLEKLKSLMPVSIHELETVLLTEGQDFCDSPHHLVEAKALERTRHTSAVLRVMLGPPAETELGLVKIPPSEKGPG